MSQDGNLSDTRIVDLFAKSNLPKPTLRDLWNKYAENSASLTKIQFFTYMRAIALCQNRIDINEHPSYLLSRHFPFVPQISGFQAPSLPRVENPNYAHMNSAFPPITENDLRNYENMIAQVDFIYTDHHQRGWNPESFRRKRYPDCLPTPKIRFEENLGFM